jgi:hypothetical protein
LSRLTKVVLLTSPYRILGSLHTCFRNSWRRKYCPNYQDMARAVAAVSLLYQRGVQSPYPTNLGGPWISIRSDRSWTVSTCCATPYNHFHGQSIKCPRSSGRQNRNSVTKRRPDVQFAANKTSKWVTSSSRHIRGLAGLSSSRASRAIYARS